MTRARAIIHSATPLVMTISTLVLFLATSPTSPAIASPASPALSAIEWRCRNANGTIDVPAKLPAVAHTALMAAGVLKGDPLYRFNERDWSWVALEDWTFEGTFSLAVDAQLLTADAVLTMEGVDTIAAVSVNGVHIGHTDDAFIRWELPVSKGTLKAGQNTISVAFTNARAAGVARASTYPYPVPASIYYHTWSEPGDMWDYNATCAAGPCQPFRNFVRKSPTDFGWDWGPSFIPTGITGGVTLSSKASGTSGTLGTSGAAPALDSLSATQEHLPNGSVVLAVRARTAAGWHATQLRARRMALRLELCLPECTAADAAANAATDASVAATNGATDAATATRTSASTGTGTGTVAGTAGAGTAGAGISMRYRTTTTVHARAWAGADAAHSPYEAQLLVETPRLWWPHGYGEQPLYELRATLVDCAAAAAAAPAATGGDDDKVNEACEPLSPSSSSPSPSSSSASLRQRIGLRTVELVQEPARPPAAGLPNGTSFYFRVNGVAVFAKGSNLIPLDVFAPRATAERARWLLGRAAAANMNMVRVWGGGRYLPDWFYDAADELGLMIWQVRAAACLMCQGSNEMMTPTVWLTPCSRLVWCDAGDDLRVCALSSRRGLPRARPHRGDAAGGAARGASVDRRLGWLE